MISILAQFLGFSVLVQHLPNKKPELRDTTINYIILHNDDAGNYQIARNTLIKRRLSYHYYIKKNGRIIELRDPTYQADHVGISYWKGLFRINRYSIGICFENKSPQEYTEEQYKSAVALIGLLQVRYPDSTSRSITGHESVALPLGRKHDPGSKFDWLKLFLMMEQYDRRSKT